MGVAAITAIQALIEKGNIQRGEKVLVNGASGGVGTSAVQIAKAHGAEVTGVCSTKNLDLVRSLGADHVLDYTREDFTRTGEHYDLIMDAVGNRSVGDYKRILSPNGRCIIVGFSGIGRAIEQTVMAPLRSKLSTKKVAHLGMAKARRSDLNALRELVGSGKIHPAIDRRFPLNQTAEAVQYLEGGHARGKVVVRVSPTPA